MEIRTIYTKVKDYIEYKKFVFEDLRAMGNISNVEILFVSVFTLFVVGFTTWWIIDSRQMEKEYQRKVQELDRHYREKQKELKIDRHSLDKMPHEFDSLEDWIRWEMENDFDRPR